MSDYDLDPGRVRTAFDRLGDGFERDAFLYGEICERLLDRLDLVNLTPATIIDAGTGTGRMARALAARYPESTIICIDFSAGMLRHMRPDGGAPSLIALGADLHALPLRPGSVDLVLSNLALPWCEDLAGVIAEFERVLTANGLLSFATVGPDTLRELRLAWAKIDQHSHINAFFDMHDIGDALLQAGLADPVMDAETLTITYGSVGQLLKELKLHGSINATQGRRRGLTPKSQLTALQHAYQRFQIDAKLPASIEIIYGHAWGTGRSAVRIEDGVASFPLERLRGRRDTK